MHDSGIPRYRLAQSHAHGLARCCLPLFHARIFGSINLSLSLPKNRGSRTIDDFSRLLHDYPQIGYSTRRLALSDDDPSLDEPACPGWLLSRSPYLPFIFSYISRLEILCLSKLNFDLIVDLSVFMKELSSCAVRRANLYKVRCSFGAFRLLFHSMPNLQVIVISSSEITDFTTLANASRRYSSLFKDEIDPDIVSFETLSYGHAIQRLPLSIQSLQIDFASPSDFILVDFLASEYAIMKNLRTVYLRLWNVELNDSCHFVRRINNICQRHPSIQVLWLDLGRRDSWWRMPRNKSRIKLNVKGVATVRLEFSFSLHNVNQSAEIYMAILDTAKTSILNVNVGGTWIRSW
ncbi:hypothetical protein BDZ89DRAFT_1160654 [Hymenopellis radicata]|nr:hypothetical protein BDZ89DRAFT_1160654 [Hymenopellis radicata]